jgi:hypothetical protein
VANKDKKRHTNKPCYTCFVETGSFENHCHEQHVEKEENKENKLVHLIDELTSNTEDSRFFKILLSIQC